MNINLISTGQVLKQIPNLRFLLEDGVFIIQDKTGRNADIVYESVQDLCEITDLKWLGVEDDSEDNIANLAYSNVKMKKSYIIYQLGRSWSLLCRDKESKAWDA